MDTPRICNYVSGLFQIITCFGIAVFTKLYVGYAVLALVVELNSIFLHLRQLLQTCGFSRSNQYYRLNSLVNLGKYSFVYLYFFFFFYVICVFFLCFFFFFFLFVFFCIFFFFFYLLKERAAKRGTTPTKATEEN